MLGWHAAEDIIFNELSTGSHSDIEQATKIARKMVTEYGMSEKLGPRTYGRREELIFLGREVDEQKDYSEETAREIDKEVQAIINEAQATAHRVINENRTQMEQLAQELMAKETVEGEELERIFSGQPPVPAGQVSPSSEETKPA
jgi:cell division protease FtsH